MVKRRRGKDSEHAGGGGVASDPQLEDPNQMGIGDTLLSSTGLSATLVKRRRGEDPGPAGGEEVASDPPLENPNPSVYLGVSRGYWFPGSGYYPLHKVDVASSDSSSPRAAAASRVANVKTDVYCKSFLTLQSRWIIGVGGDPGGTVIFDSKTGKVISGPKLVAPKLFPVVAAVISQIHRRAC
ncbi:unnamed protein product [Urochloa humidicola]